MNLKTFIAESQKSIAEVSTTIGVLTMFATTVKSEKILMEELDSPVDETEPETFIRALVKAVCIPKADLPESNAKFVDPVLNSEQIRSLTESDLENFSKLYLRYNEYLFKDLSISEGKQNLEIEHPRLKGESNVVYLHRLFQLKQSERKNRWNNIGHALSGFGGVAAEAVRSNIMAGDALREKIYKQRLEPFPTDLATKQLFQDLQKNRRADSDDVVQRLDELIQHTVESSTDQRQSLQELTSHTLDSNEAQVMLASEIKTAAEQTDGTANKNLRLTRWIIGITLVGLIVNIGFLFDARVQSGHQQVFAESSIASLSSGMESLEVAIKANNNSNEVSSLKDENAKLREDMADLEERLAELEPDNE